MGQVSGKVLEVTVGYGAQSLISFLGLGGFENCHGG